MDTKDSQNVVMVTIGLGVVAMCFTIIGAWVWQLSTNAVVNPVLGTVANIIIGGLLKLAGDMGVAWFGGKAPATK